MLFGLLLMAGTLAAQSLPAELKYSRYDWDAKRKPLPVPEAESKEPAIVLRDFSAQEYLYVGPAQDLRLFTIDHRIVRVNATDAIEQFNKIVVPLQDGAKLLFLKARTLRPGGGITEVNQGNIKELKDEDGTRGYKVFAVEGVEKGGEIEYLYALEREPRMFGRERMQSGMPQHDVAVELISPESLKYEARLYNAPAGTPQPRDTVQAGKRVTRVAFAQLPAAHPEAFAEVTAQLTRLEYKLAYNTARGSGRLFTWADAARFIHEQTYTFSKDEQKAVTRLIKDLKLPTTGDPAERIRQTELAVKTAYTLAQSAERDLVTIIKTRTAGETGFTRLFAAIFRQMGIDTELVVTCDRTEGAFDGKFDTWNYLDHYLFRFPVTGQYMAPGQITFRYGMIPAEWSATEGLFIKTVTLGQTESAVGVVKEIPALSAEQSANDHDIRVRFAPDLGHAIVDFHQTLSGYHCQPFQPLYLLIPEDKRTELLHELVKSSVPDATFQQVKASNVEANRNPLDHPFTIDATVESVGLLTKAGNRYLFKVGELIGPQSELYQTEARQFDVENDHNRRYNRTISFELPAGYRVRNLPDLNIAAHAGGDAESPVYHFRSQYTQAGNKVTVTITEAYTQIRWPKKDFEAYRNVINAAANFNKVVLVLEKEG